MLRIAMLQFQMQLVRNYSDVDQFAGVFTYDNEHLRKVCYGFYLWNELINLGFGIFIAPMMWNYAILEDVHYKTPEFTGIVTYNASWHHYMDKRVSEEVRTLTGVEEYDSCNEKYFTDKEWYLKNIRVCYLRDSAENDWKTFLSQFKSDKVLFDYGSRSEEDESKFVDGVEDIFARIKLKSKFSPIGNPNHKHLCRNFFEMSEMLQERKVETQTQEEEEEEDIDIQTELKKDENVETSLDANAELESSNEPILIPAIPDIPSMPTITTGEVPANDEMEEIEAESETGNEPPRKKQKLGSGKATATA